MFGGSDDPAGSDFVEKINFADRQCGLYARADLDAMLIRRIE
jgi:hypothetical protein